MQPSNKRKDRACEIHDNFSNVNQDHYQVPRFEIQRASPSHYASVWYSRLAKIIGIKTTASLFPDLLHVIVSYIDRRRIIFLIRDIFIRYSDDDNPDIERAQADIDDSMSCYLVSFHPDEPQLYVHGRLDPRHHYLPNIYLYDRFEVYGTVQMGQHLWVPSRDHSQFVPVFQLAKTKAKHLVENTTDPAPGDMIHATWPVKQYVYMEYTNGIARWQIQQSLDKLSFHRCRRVQTPNERFKYHSQNVVCFPMVVWQNRYLVIVTGLVKNNNAIHVMEVAVHDTDDVETEIHNETTCPWRRIHLPLTGSLRLSDKDGPQREQTLHNEQTVIMPDHDVQILWYREENHKPATILQLNLRLLLTSMTTNYKDKDQIPVQIADNSDVSRILSRIQWNEQMALPVSSPIAKVMLVAWNDYLYFIDGGPASTEYLDSGEDAHGRRQREALRGIVRMYGYNVRLHQWTGLLRLPIPFDPTVTINGQVYAHRFVAFGTNANVVTFSSGDK